MASASPRAATGIEGLDDILGGGLPVERIYLVQGDPGVGKTTLGMQFLLTGAARGERCLYITLSETRVEVEEVARSHGWLLDGIEVVELSAIEQASGLDDNTLFEPAEVELQETTRLLLDHVERVQPTRVVFDSLSELRLLAQSPLRYRRQILRLKQYFAGRRTTVLMLDDRTSEVGDLQLQSLAHGVIVLEMVTPIFGEDRRQLRIQKLRGLKFRGGRHDFTIRRGGLVVFPRLVAAEHHGEFPISVLRSGVASIDQLLGGGLDRATATLVVGPAGSGKSSLSIQYAIAAADRGERAVIYAFDERVATLRLRARGLGFALDRHLESGAIVVQQIDPAEMSPGEFTATVRDAVDKAGATMIVIDSLNGYLNAMAEERMLTVQLHELLGFLALRGVTSLMVVAQHGFVGAMTTPTDVSYLADTVILLRFFEARGDMHKAISVIKKRSGKHESTIRELTMDSRGIHVSEPLRDFHGVMTGVPEFLGGTGVGG